MTRSVGIVDEEALHVRALRMYGQRARPVNKVIEPFDGNLEEVVLWVIGDAKEPGPLDLDLIAQAEPRKGRASACSDRGLSCGGKRRQTRRRFPLVLSGPRWGTAGAVMEIGRA